MSTITVEGELKEKNNSLSPIEKNRMHLTTVLHTLALAILSSPRWP
jgi:hypothetical protein